MGALVALALLGDGAFSLGPESMNDTHMESGPVEPWGHGDLESPSISVTPLSGHPAGRVEETDAPIRPVPPGTTTYRVEVTGQETWGSVQVFATTGEASIGEVELPFALDVEVREPDSLQWLVAHSPDAPGDIQCRVYVGDTLVAIATGEGTVECLLKPG